MGNSSNLVVAGINFRKTTLDIRNKFALTENQITGIYNNTGKEILKNFFILSTCNRTEIYSSSENVDGLKQILLSHSKLSPEELEQNFFFKSNDEAITHLFRVASGLESQILGDSEIIGQLKKAFTLAKSFDQTDGYMEKLVNGALQSSRQIKNKTSLSDGTTSVSYAIIQLLKQLGETKSHKICLLGLGKIGTLTLKNLKHYLPHHEITLVNRNEDKAKKTATDYVVNYSPLDNQHDVIKNSTVLIVATGANKPIIFKEDILSSNIELIFDLSVPSNIAEEVKEIEGIKIYDVDGLSQMVNKTLEQRKNEIPLAEAILQNHFNEFKQWEERRTKYKPTNEPAIINASVSRK